MVLTKKEKTFGILAMAGIGIGALYLMSRKSTQSTIEGTPPPESLVPGQSSLLTHEQLIQQMQSQIAKDVASTTTQSVEYANILSKYDSSRTALSTAKSEALQITNQIAELKVQMQGLYDSTTTANAEENRWWQAFKAYSENLFHAQQQFEKLRADGQVILKLLEGPYDTLTEDEMYLLPGQYKIQIFTGGAREQWNQFIDKVTAFLNDPPSVYSYIESDVVPFGRSGDYKFRGIAKTTYGLKEWSEVQYLDAQKFAQQKREELATFEVQTLKPLQDKLSAININIVSLTNDVNFLVPLIEAMQKPVG